MIDRLVAKRNESVSTCSVFNGVCVSTRVVPARHESRGGDWCDVFVVSDDRLALSVGDVCGHGEGAYASMVRIRQVIRDGASSGYEPPQILSEANRFVRALDDGLTSTAIVAFLDTRCHFISYASAGHPPLLVVTSSGARYVGSPVADLPLGIEDELVPLAHVVSTPANTLVVLYTDGVTEHERLPLKGEEQLRAAASSAYWNPLSPTALAIEERMFARGTNRDDAAILTAWLPRERA